MSYKKHYLNSRPLFRKRSFKKIEANFRADFAPFLQLPFSLVEFTHIWE